LAAGVVVIWAEEATGGCTTCCCSAEFAGAVRGAVVFSAIAGGPALASGGDAETDTVAGILILLLAFRYCCWHSTISVADPGSGAF
jgi:hypothetical protein